MDNILELANRKNEKRNKQSSLIIDLANKRNPFLFHSRGERPYVRIEVKGHLEIFWVEAKGFETLLSKFFHDEFGKMPERKSLKEAVQHFSGKALFESPEEEIYVRVAPGKGEGIIVDHCDENRSLSIITPGKVLTHQKSDAMFSRVNARPLPLPQGDGKIENLWKYINVSSREDRILFIAALLQAFNPNGPYPILAIDGPPGSGKTFATEIFLKLTDPRRPFHLAPPKSIEDLMVASLNRHILAFDNFSHIKNNLSDALCRLSYGAGFSARTLHTNHGESIIETVRMSLVNSISDCIIAPDLAQRTIKIQLAPIPEEKRRRQELLEKEFENEAPGIVGDLFQALAAILKRLPDHKVTNAIRMVDFLNFASASEDYFGYPPGTFADVLSKNQKESYFNYSQDSPLVQGLIKILNDNDCHWRGQSSELLEKLNEVVPDIIIRENWWPKTPARLSGVLKQHAPAFEAIHIQYSVSQTSGTGSRKNIELSLMPESPFHPARNPKMNWDSFSSPSNRY